MVASAGLILQFEVELRQAPQLSFEEGSKLEDGPYNAKAFSLRRKVFAFRWLECSTPLTERLLLANVVGLQQVATQLVSTGTHVEREFASCLGQCQNRGMD